MKVSYIAAGIAIYYYITILLSHTNFAILDRYTSTEYSEMLLSMFLCTAFITYAIEEKKES